MSRLPKVCIIGAGAAGLWCAIRLVERGWTGANLSIVEPDTKTADDHTWSYWLREPILPSSVEKRTFSSIEIAADGRRARYETMPYWYESVRSSHFYAYAKQVLAKADVPWIAGNAENVVENADAKVEITVGMTEGVSQTIAADYVLDSRLPDLDVHNPRYHSTLQHFGGRFVRFARPVLSESVATFMDFKALDDEVAFFYVLPQSATEGLVELAVFSKTVWNHARYDQALDQYIASHFEYAGEPVAYEILGSEYGVIPMTDQPLWLDSTERIWKIGTAGGWVQPSSGYAFTRCARFAGEVADALAESGPKRWRPSSVQQVFNSVMLGHIIAHPEKAGSVFYDLFERNGAPRTFSFLDEGTSLAQTLALMWNSPRATFAKRAVSESTARLVGAK